MSNISIPLEFFSNAPTVLQLPTSKIISIADKTSLWTILFLLVTAHYTINLIRIGLKKKRFESFTSLQKCLPVRHIANPFPMPWSLNRKYEVYKAAARGDLFEGLFTRRYSKYGNTHAIISPFTQSQKGINTIDPANIQCVLATKFADYKRPAWRILAAQPVLGPGLFTSNGPVWAHWRGMAKPQFTRKKIDINLRNSERHIQLVCTALGEPGVDGWTGDVDLLVHFYRLTMDTSTQFLFGRSAETQTAALVHAGKLPASAYQPSALDGFDERFITAAWYIGHRMKLSKNMYWMYDGLEYRQACRDLYRMLDAYVTEVRSSKTSSDRSINVEGEFSNAFDEMESQGASQSDMVQLAMHLLSAGMDTFASALGWMMAMLAARPEIYQRLREEILEAFGHEEEIRSADCFTFETLKNCTYLQWCLNETLRLFPGVPINVREAVRDTVLPVGGGPDGMGPVAVAKGSRVQMGTYFMHRRKDLWGEDAEEFRPERWAGRRRGWDFTPFSGGPQVCIGQGYTTAQLSFIVARLAMRYDKIEPSLGSNNEKRSWMTVLTPGDGVKVRLHVAPGRDGA